MLMLNVSPQNAGPSTTQSSVVQPGLPSGSSSPQSHDEGEVLLHYPRHESAPEQHPSVSHPPNAPGHRSAPMTPSVIQHSEAILREAGTPETNVFYEQVSEVTLPRS